MNDFWQKPVIQIILRDHDDHAKYGDVFVACPFQLKKKSPDWLPLGTWNSPNTCDLRSSRGISTPPENPSIMGIMKPEIMENHSS